MAGFLAGEWWIRLGIAAGVFAAMAAWEVRAPRRPQAIGRWRRWPNNLGILIANTIILRLLFPTAILGLAVSGEERGWGLLNSLRLPPWIAVIVAVIVLDLAIYFQHVLFHAVPALWRLHRMHHADLEFDVTTGVRFHPVEIVFSMIIKLGVVLAVGAPALAVLIFEVLLNATSMFNHGFGFNLPWWDRLFDTYRAQPAAGQAGMTIGIDLFRRVEDLRLDRMLIQPLIRAAGRYPINRRDC